LGDVAAVVETDLVGLVLRPAFEAGDRLQLIDHIRNLDPPRPRALDRSIPRNLETIVLTAIHKEPKRRYQTAEAMAEDLRRFLAMSHWKLGDKEKARTTYHQALEWMAKNQPKLEKDQTRLKELCGAGLDSKWAASARNWAISGLPGLVDSIQRAAGPNDRGASISSYGLTLTSKGEAVWCSWDAQP
jgi:hypothetical protein